MRDHTSLIAWQEARQVASDILDLSETRWTPALGAVWGQLQRSSLSVQLNIVEGYALGTGALFTKHLRIAYGSAVETGELLDHLAARLRPPHPTLQTTNTHCTHTPR